MSVFLSARGEKFDVDAFLIGSTLEADDVFYFGRKSNSLSRAAKASGFSVYISEEPDTLRALSDAAAAYLENHKIELAHLQSHPGVSEITLDFYYDHRPEAAIQCDFLPAKLLALAGSLNIDIELSLCNKGYDEFKDGLE